MKSIDFLGKVLGLYTKRFIDYTNGKLEKNPNIESLTEVSMNPELVEKITNLIPKVKNDLSLLDEIYEYEYKLFPVLRDKVMRDRLLNSTLELMKEHDLKIMIDQGENESDIKFTHYTKETINMAIIFYQDLVRKSERLRNVLLAPLEDHLSKFEEADTLPEPIINYLEPYRLSQSEQNVLKLVDELKVTSHPKEHLFRDDESKLELFFKHFSDDETISEDIEFMTKYLSSLYEQYENNSDDNILLENEINIILEELDVDDFYDDEDEEEFKLASKELNKADDKIDKMKEEKVSKSDQEYKEIENERSSAVKMVIKSAKKIKKLLTKAISLKSENIEKTLSFRYKVLRIAIAAFVIAGSVYVPAGLILKLISLIVSASAVDSYSTSRANRTVKVLENQLDNLDNRIDDEDDEDKIKELKNLRTDIESNIDEVRKRIKNYNKGKKTIKNKLTKSSSDSDDVYDY